MLETQSKLEFSHTAGGTPKSYSHFENHFGSVLCAKTESADVIKDLEVGEMILHYPNGPSVIINVLIKGEQKDWS